MKSSRKSNSNSNSNSNCNCFANCHCQRESLGGGGSTKRFLISVSVLGSPGPFRFLVNEEELVAHVIDMALKLYAKEGRLPLMLSSHSDHFFLYCANLSSDEMSPWDEIGSFGVRNFVLCKKPEQLPNMTQGRSEMISRKRGGSWKSWLNKSLSFKILSH